MMPPLNSLIAFEAAARCGTLQRAATELGVTHGAVSRHIKQLEDWLQVRLFDRSHGRLILTAKGRNYLRSVSNGFEQIAEGTESLRCTQQPNVIRVSTTNTIASCLLIPRIADFQTCHPRLSLSIQTDHRYIDFADDSADIALRMGDGAWSGVRSEPLMGDRLTALISPALLAKQGPLEKLEDLKCFRLIHGADAHAQWPEWLRRVGGPEIAKSSYLNMTASNCVLRAAIAGQGVALGRTVLASSALFMGALLAPLPQAVEIETAYWLVAPERNWRRHKVALFADWAKSALPSPDETLATAC